MIQAKYTRVTDNIGQLRRRAELHFERIVLKVQGLLVIKSKNQAQLTQLIRKRGPDFNGSNSNEVLVGGAFTFRDIVFDKIKSVNQARNFRLKLLQ